MNKNNDLAKLFKNTSFLNWLNKEDNVDNASWEEWQQESPQNAQLVEMARLAEKGIPFKKQPENQVATKAGWTKLMNEIEQPTTKNITLKSETASLFGRKWLSIAATIALLMFVAAGIYTYFHQPEQIYHQTKFAENKTIQLPDGTVVTLAANSSLSYDEDLAEQDNRVVQLAGEAYFEVQTQSVGKRFMVESKDLSIAVIGTEFNINSHRTHSIISLVEGEIALNKAGIAEKIMRPGQTIRFNEEISTFELLDNQTDYWGDWRFQKWSFGEGMPMKELIQRIEETFGLVVQVTDERILEKQASGSINIDNQQVLFESLSYLLNLQFQVNGQEVTISLKPEAYN